MCRWTFRVGYTGRWLLAVWLLERSPQRGFLKESSAGLVFYAGVTVSGFLAGTGVAVSGCLIGSSAALTLHTNKVNSAAKTLFFFE